MMPPQREYTSDGGRNEMAPAAFYAVGPCGAEALAGVKQKIEVSIMLPSGQLA